jgi:hypothetical protein
VQIDRRRRLRAASVRKTSTFQFNPNAWFSAIPDVWFRRIRNHLYFSYTPDLGGACWLM